MLRLYELTMDRRQWTNGMGEWTMEIRKFVNP